MFVTLSTTNLSSHFPQNKFKTRQIVNAVLRIVPDANADLDRFQISCFVHKMTTQFMWGMTVWRAFPLERTTFFTVTKLYASWVKIKKTFIFSAYFGYCDLLLVAIPIQGRYGTQSAVYGGDGCV